MRRQACSGFLVDRKKHDFLKVPGILLHKKLRSKTISPDEACCHSHHQKSLDSFEGDHRLAKEIGGLEAAKEEPRCHKKGPIWQQKSVQKKR